MATKTRVDGDLIQRAVLRMRGQNVLLDVDLATLYGVDVRVLNQAVSRNGSRFPADFKFTLTAAEAASLRSQTVILDKARQSSQRRQRVTGSARRRGNALRSQIVTLDAGRGRHRKYLPQAFTEQGVGMLSSVLRGNRAVRVNIEIMRTFVQLRRMLGVNEELGRKLAALERKYDGQFQVVFEAIRELMAPPRPPRRAIGFRGR
jgi:hypothetical protein